MLALLMSYSDDWEFKKDHLIQVTGMGRDKFERAMGELRKAGYVDLVQARDEGGRLLGTTWVIKDDRGPENPVLGDTEALKNRAPAEPCPGKSAPIRIPIEKKTKREEHNAPEGALFPEDEIPEVKDDKQKVDEAFTRFWASYPPKRRTDRPKALEVFQRIVTGKHKTIGKTDPETILSGLARFAASSRDPEFDPMPTTWLNGARWEQYPAPSVQPMTAEERRARMRPSWMTYG